MNAASQEETGETMSLMLIYCWSNMLLISRSFMGSSVIEHGRFTCLAGLQQGNSRKMTDGWLSGPGLHGATEPSKAVGMKRNLSKYMSCYMLEILSKCNLLKSMSKHQKTTILHAKQQWLKKTQMPCVFVSKPACHVMPASLSLSLSTRLQSQKKCQRRQESFQQYLHTFMHSFFCHSHQCIDKSPTVR